MSLSGVSSSARGLWTILRRPPRERALLLEALVCLAVSSAMIRLISFKQIAVRAARPPSGTAIDPHSIPLTTYRRIKWAIRAWAARAPWRAMCFEQGVAAQTMLRRRGITSTLYYGVAKDPSKGLKAHVWVEAGGIDVIGCENRSDYSVLATFPGNENLIT